MATFPGALQRLVSELTKLPSIGEKTAIRLAYHLVTNDKGLATSLVQALQGAHNQVRLCSRCFFLAEQEICTICASSGRDNSLLCVVEKPMDVLAIERVGEYRGHYHVLHGLWAPLKGLGPDKMKIAELKERLSKEPIREVIIATGATVEGDATALYLAKILGEFSVTSSRLAQGIPKGGELEYADDLTLARAFSGRNVMVR